MRPWAQMSVEGWRQTLAVLLRGGGKLGCEIGEVSLLVKYRGLQSWWTMTVSTHRYHPTDERYKIHDPFFPTDRRPRIHFPKSASQSRVEGAYSERCEASREALRPIHGVRLRPKRGRKGTATRDLPKWWERRARRRVAYSPTQHGQDGSNRQGDAVAEAEAD